MSEQEIDLKEFLERLTPEQRIIVRQHLICYGESLMFINDDGSLEVVDPSKVSYTYDRNGIMTGMKMNNICN